MMVLTTNRRELKDTIDGVNAGADIGDIEDGLRLALAQALAAVARLVDKQPEGPDLELTLWAEVNAKSATVSVRVGEPIAPPEVEPPFENSYWADLDKERQERQGQADDAEAERIRGLLKR
jgi:hypothetical protein